MQGRVVEQSRTEALFKSPQHPYTIGLLGATPEAAAGARLTPILGRVALPSDRLAGCRFAPRCPFSVGRCTTSTRAARRRGRSARRLLAGAAGRLAAMSAAPTLEVENLGKVFDGGPGFFGLGRKQAVRAVDNVSFSVRRGETLGIVGESGSGKSTTARLLLGLIEPTYGTVRLHGEDLSQPVGARVAPPSPRHADGIPGSLRLAQSAPRRRVPARRAIARARAVHGR